MQDDRLTGNHRPNRSPASPKGAKLLFPLVFLPVLTACSGVQSALDPAGLEAEAVAQLFWVMVVGGGVIWLLVVGLVVFASRFQKTPLKEASAGRIILYGGAVFPVVVLTALLSYAVWLMPAMRPWFGGEGEGLRRIEITAEQFWWRVRYLDASGAVTRETANHVTLPVGERVLFLLKAKDVIHSFWIPSIGGKMDAIPGRVNELQLQATKTGTYRGVCAEFCGTAHTLMAFTVEVLEPAAFDAWLAAAPAAAAAPGSAPGETTTTVTAGSEPADVSADVADMHPGLRLFLRHGCSSCHAIAGTPAEGALGPNLTAFGTRPTVAAGTLPNTAENIRRFIQYPEGVKPGARMPDFAMLPQTEVEAIAQYLKGLQ
ncbi:cytochrome c oxidase subunit II [Rhizobium sp. SSA_523]|uniref:cytochrome c oxidase subunit II n=1 Tax=Rhizobium sp. SSA_523 TaxID=2952477 RepID=UPI002091041F|nr:cytochrome c oxidase subunit II [Rhizobium sp. SSA_523]MCO5731725.1 cytochrome c oxidase subunit II [Rhizobium sp. SSA_523]WKC22902.1 cytochrome c oxidase subunit II [Rhizobium sp. SSA_523]